MEVTASPRVAFLPCSYGKPIGLGISFVIFKGIVLGDVAPSYPVILVCRGQGCPRQYGFPSTVLGHFFLLGVSLGFGTEWVEACRTFWPYNNPSKSCCPDPRTRRRILTFSGLRHDWLSLVSLWVPKFPRLLMARSWHFGVRGAPLSMLFL